MDETGNKCEHQLDDLYRNTLCGDFCYIRYNGIGYCKKHFSEVYNRLVREKEHIVGRQTFLVEETQRMADAERKLLRSFEESFYRQSSSDIVTAFEQVDRELKQQLPNYSLTERMRQIFMDREARKRLIDVHPEEFSGSDY